MKTPRLLLPAEEEMLDAAFYYEQQSTGLGQDFLRKVQNAVEEIVQHPTRWPKVRGNIRRRMIHRFPYAVLYEDQPHEILIIAVMHLRRHPAYWIERTS
jgi:plasmid stabilization system protein ParE